MHDDIRSGAWRSKPATSLAQKAPGPRTKAPATRSLAGQTLAAN